MFRFFKVNEDLFYKELLSDNLDVNKIQKYIDKGIDLNKKDEKGRTILFLLASKRKLDAIRILLRNGANLYIEDKFSRLDVKALTSNKEIINIEIQLKNEYNMIQRSLYYWSKLYEEQLSEGDRYDKLSRTVCINILDFKYLKN